MAFAISFRQSPTPASLALSLTLGLALAAGTAAADPVSDGQAIATQGAGGVVACATCHGAKGEGMAAAGFPYLAGQGAAYLKLQLEDFASGKRDNPVMAPIAKAMNASQMEAAAAYFASLPPAFDAVALSNHQDSQPARDDTGAWLANRGDWEHGIPACIQCHGPGGVGVGQDFPALAGQSANYLRAQMVAIKEGKRPPGPLGLMGDIASRMTDAQITAAADYFAALPQAIQGANQGAQQ